MMSFMFGVLGSIVFWGIYFLISFVIGSAMLKRIAPKTYNFVIGEGPHPGYDDDIGWVFVAIGVFLFWQIVIIWKIISFIVGNILCPMLKNAIKASANIVPDIEIKKAKK